MIPVTVIIVTKDAHHLLETCLSRLKSFDEVIVVNSGESEETSALC